VHLELGWEAHQGSYDLVARILLFATELVEDPLNVMASGPVFCAAIICCGRVLIDVDGSIVQNTEKGHDLSRILTDIFARIHELSLGARGCAHGIYCHVAVCNRHQYVVEFRHQTVGREEQIPDDIALSAIQGAKLVLDGLIDTCELGIIQGVKNVEVVAGTSAAIRKSRLNRRPLHLICKGSGVEGLDRVSRVVVFWALHWRLNSKVPCARIRMVHKVLLQSYHRHTRALDKS
jgi:hypothetical protein